MLCTTMKLVVVLLILGCGSNSLADVITVPNVPAGTQYRLAFLTSGIRNAASPNIEDYNTFVTQQANQNLALSALGTTWKAIGSTAAIDARNNTETNPNVSVGVPVYRLDGLLVAISNDDLWDGYPVEPLNIDQHGNILINRYVWTGSFFFGTANDYLGAPDFVTLGKSDAPALWIDAFIGEDPSLYNTSLYAISGVLTAVPEPSSSQLVGLVALARLLPRRHRKK